MSLAKAAEKMEEVKDLENIVKAEKGKHNGAVNRFILI